MSLPKELVGYWDRYKPETDAYWARVSKEKDIAGVTPHVYPWTQVPVFSDLMLFLILATLPFAADRPDPVSPVSDAV